MQIITKRSFDKKHYLAKGIIWLGDGLIFNAKFKAKSLRLARVGLKKKLLLIKKEHENKIIRLSFFDN
jgi:hypothetical protein